MNNRSLLRTSIVLLLSLVFIFGTVACSEEDNTESLMEKVASLQQEAEENAALIESLQSEAEEHREKIEALESELEKRDPNRYDFYITLGTMPTLYATMNAYAQKNPNTYMWFLRGNTISFEYSDATIRYFDTQSETSDNSIIDYTVIREQVKSILKKNPNATFHLYCDDSRVRLIPDIFIAAGVDFDDLQVTFLLDGTSSYANFSKLTDAAYVTHIAQWEQILQEYEEGRGDPSFESIYPQDGQATEMRMLAYYLSTYDNVEIWAQNPEYLTNRGEIVTASLQSEMNIVKKDPTAMYLALDEATRDAYQKAVLANALVDSDTLLTLEDAANYFDGMLKGRDKDVVIILGTDKQSLAENKFYMEATLAYYTPTRDPFNATKVRYKGVEYTVNASATEISVDGRDLEIGKLGAYLFFKAHPSYPAKQSLTEYFEEKGIVLLPHKAPVEVLLLMYDVKCGGYQSTSYLSTRQGQTEFFYEEPTTEAILLMKEMGFFDGASVFISGK